LLRGIARDGSYLAIETVVKFGSVVEHAGHFETLLSVLAGIGASWKKPLLIVPGGGPFADTVRDLDRRIGLSDDAAHWMAVLAMNQYAYLIVSRLRGSALVEDRLEIAAALENGHIPVLAPFRWLRQVDPLPHAWTVTSDTIAAWISGQVGARCLLLVKPPGAWGPDLVDEHFARVAPPGITRLIVAADQMDVLRAALSEQGGTAGAKQPDRGCKADRIEM
jgi:aspartokinase-like uncharacterized kinase